MKQYKLINNLLGWLTFAIAAFVFCSTIEPTASFWDCPEFITTGYKLEIGHPPGAPFFMLTANLFSQFASDPTTVAKMVNTMSALLSAACIMFLFWSITYLAKKLVCPNEEQMNSSKMCTIMASGLVGALCYTFSDTFWYSAVEGEVYAYSSLFTAVVFWLILKWDAQADNSHSDRYLVLLSYLVGLSIGVHLLNLLCIPAIVLVYYYKKNPNAELKGSLLALGASMILIVAVLYGVVPGIVKVGGWFELLFVNTLGFGFNTGLIIYLVLLCSSVVWGVYESYVGENRVRQNISFVLSVALLGIPFYGHGALSVIIGIVVLAVLYFGVNFKKQGKSIVSSRILNTSLLSMLVMIIGYSSYALIVIRSSANPPMDQNSPEDIFTLGEYLGREQYGSRPLFYGQAYTSQVKLKVDENGGYCVPVTKEGAPVYQRKEKHDASEPDRYFVVRNKYEYEYAQNMLFPRIYSSDHAKAYEDWLGGVEGTQVPYDRCGEMISVKMPSQLDNLKFFFSYQVNFMYWRYFLWNFAGRQNDIQSNGEIEHGNWITGIKPFDKYVLGIDMDKMPSELKENKGYNVFFALPLILGLLGIYWQAFQKKEAGIQQFWVVFFLFFMTGIAIVLYLNQTPQQPRERDYAYAGSFYAFAIWIGLGVAALVENVNKFVLKKENSIVTSAVVGCLCLLVPIQMCSQTWDDHDRSGRYTCRDFGQNYLNSLNGQNPIIFTNGDNDTFPLWYNQETEGVGTSARVCNLSYLQTDWYIDQMRRQAYDSPALPINWKRYEYESGTNEYISIHPEYKEAIAKMYAENRAEAEKAFGKDPFELKNVLKYWVRSTNEETHLIPTDTLYITIDKNAVRKSGMMMPSDSIPDKMCISLAGKRALYKSDLMMLELLAQTNWVRPLFVAITVGADNYMNLGDNFIQEGLVNRITPFNTTKCIRMDTEKTYNMLMNKFKFGGLETPGLYLDETVMRMCYTHRRLFGELAKNLLAEGKREKAVKVVDYVEKHIPAYNVPHDFQSGSLEIAKIYALTGQKNQANKILNQLEKKSFEYCDYYLSLNSDRFKMNAQDYQYHIYILNEIVSLLRNQRFSNSDNVAKKLDSYINLYYKKMGYSGAPAEHNVEGDINSDSIIEEGE